jgi:hypothetical protein
VSDQIAGIQNISKFIATGIDDTSPAISHLDAVQSRMSEVLEEQARMARAFEQTT